MRQAPDPWISGDPTLLVIEDAKDDRSLIRVAARRAYPLLDVRVAGDGREGIAYLAGTPPFQHRWAHPLPDLVILDLLMPNVDGFEVLEWMRENRFVAHMPTVVLTASTDPRDEERAMAAEATAFYRKPEGLEQLGELVGGMVKRWITDPREAEEQTRRRA